MTLEEFIKSDEWKELQEVLFYIILCKKRQLEPNKHIRKIVEESCALVNGRLLAEFNKFKDDL